MELGSWSALNLSIKHRIATQAELFVAVTNLLDEDYETVIGNPAPGISPRVGFRAWF
jgi:outer membrane cobalamin receptor